MLKRIFPVEATVQKIRIPQVSGDLRISGWEREEISAHTDGDVLELSGETTEKVLTCNGELVLSLPRRLALEVSSVVGDADVRNLAGRVSLGEIEGDLSLRMGGATTIGVVHGDLEARQSGPLTVDTVHADLKVKGGDGDLTVRLVNGDVSLQEIRGNVTLGSVADDLYVRKVEGNLEAQVEGDAVLYLHPTPGQAIQVSARSDILLHLPPQVSARLTLSAGRAEEIRVDMPGVPRRDGSNPRTVTLGDGEAAIVLKAEGEVRVTSREADWSAAAEMDFGEKWSSPEDLGQQIRRQVEARIRQATRRVEEVVQRRGRAFSFQWRGTSSATAASRTGTPASEPVSEQERLFILRMLEQKKITVEEAEKLLAALEGEGG